MRPLVFEFLGGFIYVLYSFIKRHGTKCLKTVTLHGAIDFQMESFQRDSYS